MSIAITAPQKFDFQDIACVEMMLRFAAYDGTTFFVEPRDGEDGELRLVNPNLASLYEIQVKGAAGSVTLATVASCLTHTPAWSVEETLLERLLIHRDRMAVLVMEGRLDDAALTFGVSRGWRGEPHSANKISREQAKTLLSAFAAAKTGGAEGRKLNRARRAHNALLAKSADIGEVREALHRLIIIEQVDESMLEAQCAERLRRDHAIPGDRTLDVLRQLRAVVKEAKSTATDAMRGVRQALASAAQGPIRPGYYVQRGVEAALLEVLSQEGVLLLSGTPRVGKSFAARWIAAEFVQYGYEVQEFGDVEGTERFLLDPTSSLRLAILDDPLGGSQRSPDASRGLERLERLIARLHPHRKLIVAQGLSPLLETVRAASLDAVRTARKQWHDTSDLPPQFLAAVWHSLTTTIDVEAKLKCYVADALRDGRLTLEPGCLEHLAASAHRLPKAATLNDIERLGRENAADLGRALVDERLDDIAISLALTTTAQEAIGAPELAYARGAGGPTLPGKSQSYSIRIRRLGEAEESAEVPNYDTSPKLSDDEYRALDGLERRRIVAIESAQTVKFVHPFYRAAAEMLLDAPTYYLSQQVVQTIERGLFCLSPRTSRATARNIEWIFDRLAAREAARLALIDQAIQGLQSYFPATRDLCFRFLVRRLYDLPADRRSDFPRWIASVTSIHLIDLEWTDGEAHLPFSDVVGMNYFRRASRNVSRADVEAELTLLDRSKTYVSPERAARVLAYLESEPGAMTMPMTGRLLSYDEAALRAETIELWLGSLRTEDEAILDRIFADDHPSCAVAALKGAIRGWHNFDSARQVRVLDGLACLARNLAASAAMLDRLVMFNRVEKVGANPPWLIFERVLPIVMEALPHNAAFMDARLFSVARSALKVLHPESLVAICDAWIGWLERNELAGTLPSESSLGVSEILLVATREQPYLRCGRIRRLLAFNGTGATMTFVADLVNHWDTLTVEERDQLLDRLTSGRSDDRWVQAVAVTRPNVAPPILERLLPHGLRTLQPSQLQVTMGRDLFAAALHVYTGRPQPLWWLGTNRSGDTFWEAVVEAKARLPDDPLFDTAWNHIAFTGDGKRVAKIIADVGSRGADRMLHTLLRIKVHCAGHFMPEAWAALLRLAEDESQHRRWLDRLAEAAPAILDGLEELQDWLSEARDQSGVLNRLGNDAKLLQLVFMIRDLHQPGIGDEAKKHLGQILFVLVRQMPPALYRTCDRLQEDLARLSIEEPDLVATLKARREAILAQMPAIKKSFEQADPPLIGWVLP